MTARPAFAALRSHHATGSPKDMRKAFADDPGRFARYSAARSTISCSTGRNARCRTRR